MYQIRTLNKISKKGLAQLGENYSCADEIANPDGVILRSFKMHDMELPDSLRAVARAGAGVNNIPIDKCTEKGIVVFNTPGANANAVKELVLAALLLSSRKIVQGIEWTKTLIGEGDAISGLVEKGKSILSARKLKEKRWALSAWVQSVSALPTRRITLEWTSSALTRICRLTRLGI